MKKKLWIVAVVLALLVTGTVVWATMFRGKAVNPKFTKLEQLRTEVMGKAADPTLDLQKRMEVSQQFADEMQKLPEETRRNIKSTWPASKKKTNG